MARLASFTILLVLALAAPALGHDGGQGWYGETNDKAVTNGGFLLIAFFPLFVLLMSLLQWQLEKRKDRRKAAAKGRQTRAEWRGGW